MTASSLGKNSNPPNPMPVCHFNTSRPFFFFFFFFFFFLATKQMQTRIGPFQRNRPTSQIRSARPHEIADCSKMPPTRLPPNTPATCPEADRPAPRAADHIQPKPNNHQHPATCHNVTYRHVSRKRAMPEEQAVVEIELHHVNGTSNPELHVPCHVYADSKGHKTQTSADISRVLVMGGITFTPSQYRDRPASQWTRLQPHRREGGETCRQ